MTTWQPLDPNSLLPDRLEKVITEATEWISKHLNEIAAKGDSLASFSLPGIGKGSSAIGVLATVLNTLLESLSALISGGRVHAIAIPIVKDIPEKKITLPPTLNALQEALNIALGPPTTAEAEAYNNVRNALGGNAGFYQTFAQSLADTKDANRPQYNNESDAVVMVTLLAGAPRYTSLVPAAILFEQLARPPEGNSLLARTLPSPQNARAKVVATTTKKGIGVQVKWDLPSKGYAGAYFPGLFITIKRVAVIRTTDPKAASTTHVLDLFPTMNLTQGMTSGKSEVIYIGSGKGTYYLDESVTLDPEVPTYYLIAWEYTVEEDGASEATLTFDRVSNVCKVVTTKAPQSQTGVPPNWVATPTAISMFPPLATAVESLTENAKKYVRPSAKATKAAARLSGAFKLLTGSAERLSARAMDLNGDVQRIKAALSRPLPSIYATIMYSPKGGNAYLLNELSTRLGDKTDPSRPPFDAGEYVCGICLVAGAPRFADLAATINFFEALFGSSTAPNPLLNILASINTAVTQAEAAVFGTNMQLVTIETATETAASTPVIAADGTPVSGDSPENPNAGFTNVTPVSELC